MKHLRLVLILLLATGLLYNCTPKPLVYNTNYDFDINAEFSDQKRYAWLPLPITSTIDPLSIERIKYYADAALRRKGWLKFMTTLIFSSKRISAFRVNWTPPAVRKITVSTGKDHCF